MAETGSGDSQEVTRDQKYELFANKYQLVVEDVNGKKMTIQHPFITIDECKELAGDMKTTYPENKIYSEDTIQTCAAGEIRCGMCIICVSCEHDNHFTNYHRLKMSYQYHSELYCL